MGASSMPEWLNKLMELWDRRDTSGFYEFEELFENQLAKEKMELVEEIRQRLILKGQQPLDSVPTYEINEELDRALKSEIQEKEKVGKE